MIGALTLPAARKVFKLIAVDSADAKGFTAQKEAIFNTCNSTQAYELFHGVSGFSMATPFNDTMYPASANMTAQYQLQITPQMYGLRSDVSMLARETDQYNIISRTGELMSDAWYTRLGYYMGSIFGNAFTTSSATNGADGVSLINAAHPVKGGGASYSNIDVQASFGYFSVESLRSVLVSQKDPTGKRFRYLDGWTLVVPRELELRAQRLQQTPNISGSQDRDKNVIAKLFDIQALDYLGDFSVLNYFALAKSSRINPLQWVDQIELQTNVTKGPFAEYIYTVQGSFGAGWRNGFGIVGNVGQ